MDCNGCKQSEQKKPPIMVTVPLTHLEAKDIRYHQLVKRMIIGFVICALLIFAEAGIFVWLWNQYDFSDTGAVIDNVGSDNEDSPFGDITITVGPSVPSGGNAR